MKVLLPATLDETLRMLATEEAVPIAGGTDLLVNWPQHLDNHERTYVDLSGIDELGTMTWDNDHLSLGALTTYWDLIRDHRVSGEFPLLHDAARTVGAVQIQSRGTWAGNIANASPAADGVPALMACDASVVLRSTTGEEEVPLDRFFTGYKQMRRRPDQLITAIRVPRRERVFQRFVKVGSRRAQAITKVGLAIVRDDTGWRVVANSVAPTVQRCPNVERVIETGQPVSSPDDLLPAIRQDVSPIDDIRSTAAYRERVMSRILFHDLSGVCRSIGARP